MKDAHSLASRNIRVLSIFEKDLNHQSDYKYTTTKNIFFAINKGKENQVLNAKVVKFNLDQYYYDPTQEFIYINPTRFSIYDMITMPPHDFERASHLLEFCKVKASVATDSEAAEREKLNAEHYLFKIPTKFFSKDDFDRLTNNY
jgi:hypothetical protein